LHWRRRNKSKTKAALEEEEVGRYRDLGVNKEEHMDHPYVMSSPLPFGGVLHNPQWVIYIFFLLRLVVQSCTRLFNIASNSGVWMLGTYYEHPTVETLRVVHKFSVVVLKSSYTRFLSGPLNDPAFNRKSRSRSRWIKGSSPYLSFKRLLYVSWKEK